MELDIDTRVEDTPASGNLNVENIANQIVVETIMLPSLSNVESYNRLDFVKSQKNNRYSPLNYSYSYSPYLVHVEYLDRNIGNFHLMSLRKVLAEFFPTINNIKRRGKNLIVLNFKFSFDANQFVQSNILSSNWIAYIPNYKIFRTGIVRGVDLALSVEEILRGIKFMDRPIKIKSITRLKYRDKNNNNKLKDSSSINIEFLSNLLPEFISI